LPYPSKEKTKQDKVLRHCCYEDDVNAGVVFEADHQS